MAIANAEEAQLVIEQFEREYGSRLALGSVLGIQVEADTLILEIPEGAPLNLRNLAVPAKFLASLGEQRVELKVRLQHTQIYDALTSDAVADSKDVGILHVPVASGHPVIGEGMIGFGTLGWIVELDDQMVGISNWHVMCPDETTQIGHNILVHNAHFGILLEREITPYFDLAICLVSDPNAVDLNRMMPCDDGTRHLRPGKLGTAKDVIFGADFYKVGATAPICRRGKFFRFGDARVRYHDGKIRSFRRQLHFTKMTDRGDSGSLIIAESSNTVCGLNFAGDDDTTIANPLYGKNWTYVGTKAYPQGDVPAFVTKRIDQRKAALAHFNLAADGLQTGNLPPDFKVGAKITQVLTINEVTKRYLESPTRRSFPGVIDPSVTIDEAKGEWIRFIDGSLLHVGSGLVYKID